MGVQWVTQLRRGSYEWIKDSGEGSKGDDWTAVSLGKYLLSAWVTHSDGVVRVKFNYILCPGLEGQRQDAWGVETRTSWSKPWVEWPPSSETPWRTSILLGRSFPGESTPVWRVLDWCQEVRQRLRPWVSWTTHQPWCGCWEDNLWVEQGRNHWRKTQSGSESWGVPEQVSWSQESPSLTAPWRLDCSHRRHLFDSWIEKIPWRRAWQPTPVFLLRESHGQRSLEVYSPWGWKNWTWLKRFSMHHTNI